MSRQRKGVRSGDRVRANNEHPISSNSSIDEVSPDDTIPDDPSSLEHLPVTYQAINDYYTQVASSHPSGQVNLFLLRKETFSRIEKVTGRPLICYVTRTNLYGLPQGIPAYIDDTDLVGFGDLTKSVQSEDIDVLVVSNGGAAESSERIVRLLRECFKTVRFIVPANAFSAATLMCFSGDEILMDALSSLGPIDPQFNGIPARAILRAFETLEKRFIEEGPRILTAYAPLIEKYDLHLLEICKSAEQLSRELARTWLSAYMLKCDETDESVDDLVKFFADYDTHKSHGRSIDRMRAKKLGLKVNNLEDINGLADLVRSLYNQYVFFFERTPFYKLFENGNGISWGPSINIQQINQTPSDTQK